MVYWNPCRISLRPAFGDAPASGKVLNLRRLAGSTPKKSSHRSHRVNLALSPQRVAYLRPMHLLYSVKYFAARDCAPGPKTLAAALLPSSFRNKDFASFFSCSDTSA